jgi:ADP-ribose pyrophosphatase
VTEQNFNPSDVEIESRTVCHSGFLTIEAITLRHRLYEGGWSQTMRRELMRRKPGVGVLLYDPDLDKVVLVEQFRIGCLDDRRHGPWAVELVAGIIDADETPAEVAIREAREEANVGISNLIPVTEYYNSPGGSDEKIWVYCAAVDASRVSGIHGVSSEHEDIRVVVMSRQQADQAVADGKIANAMAIIALQWLRINLALVRNTFKGQKQAVFEKQS